MASDLWSSRERSWHHPASSMDHAHPDFSGVTGRSLRGTFYRTAAGKIVVGKIFETQWQGEHDHDEAEVYDSLTEALDALVDHCPAWQYAELVDALGADAVAEKIE